jgi:uncharacterized protein (TIGR03435 family)
MRAGGVTMQELAAVLTPLAGRLVIDKSEIVGRYDVELTWTPEQRPQEKGGDSLLPPPNPDAPSLFTAVQEQLGLKLTGERGPVDVLVIDSFERPSEN